MPDEVAEPESQYIFDNAGQPTADRFSGLASVFDPGSFRHLAGLGVQPGWQCLEVGGGNGSVAQWLGEQVGSTGREQALARMIAALKPGGWLLAEEFDALSMSSNAATHPGERYLKLEEAQQRLMRDRGADTIYGRRLPPKLAAHGLINVEAEGQVFFWHGGSAGAQIKRANYLQLREEMLTAGDVSAEEMAEELRALEDPSTLFLSPVMWSVRGQRPGVE